ncbi:MAG: hypothetical protein KBF78_04340 [Fuscovulum sp.]|nr:hypothetical protein [Fuscovulum sp.]
MPVTFQILRDRGTVYVRYDGQARIAETIEAFAAYTTDPDCRPGQRQLVDLSGLTGVETDYLSLMQMQAIKADHFGREGQQTLIAYFAPSRKGQDLALAVLRSWDGVDRVAARMFEDEAAALAFLGLPERRIADLLETAG